MIDKANQRVESDFHIVIKSKIDIDLFFHPSKTDFQKIKNKIQYLQKSN